jgi:hypothetical protein
MVLAWQAPGWMGVAAMTVTSWALAVHLAAALLSGMAMLAALAALPAGPAWASPAGVPDKFTPIGGISVGYSADPPRDFSRERKPMSQTVYRGRWSHPAG